MAERPTFAEIRARMARLHDPSASPNSAQPSGSATPDQLGAMRESMGILVDPAGLLRVRRGREAVAIDDVIALEQIDGCAPGTGDWTVRVTGPVVRELAQTAHPSADAVRAQFSALTVAPTEQGTALGMGLAGMRSAPGESHRLLYAVHEGERLVTVLAVEFR